MTPAWIVYSWTPVLWQAASAPQLHLVHLGTRVLTFGDDDCPCSGQTLWGDQNERHAVHQEEAGGGQSEHQPGAVNRQGFGNSENDDHEPFHSDHCRS